MGWWVGRAIGEPSKPTTDHEIWKPWNKAEEGKAWYLSLQCTGPKVTTDKLDLHAAR